MWPAHLGHLLRLQFPPLVELSLMPDTAVGIGLDTLFSRNLLTPVLCLPCPHLAHLSVTSALWCPPPTPQFWMLIVATTIPIPAGYFMPLFIYGESGVLRL